MKKDAFVSRDTDAY